MEAELIRQLISSLTTPEANPQPSALGTDPTRARGVGGSQGKILIHLPALWSPLRMKKGQNGLWGSNHRVVGQVCVLFQEEAFSSCIEQAGMGGAGGGISAPGQVPVSPGAMRGALGWAWGWGHSHPTALGKQDISCALPVLPLTPEYKGKAPAIVQVLKVFYERRISLKCNSFFGEGSFTWLIHHKLYYCFTPYCRFTTRCFRDLAFSPWNIPCTVFRADRQVVVKSTITVRAGKFCLNMIKKKKSIISILWLMIVYCKCTLISIIYSQYFIAAFMIWQAKLWEHI